MNFIISQELAQTLLNYLITRPYVEVFQLVAQLQGMVKVEPENKEEVVNKVE